MLTVLASLGPREHFVWRFVCLKRLLRRRLSALHADLISADDYSEWRQFGKRTCVPERLEKEASIKCDSLS